jgi:multicomponent Na+:H+ antiporter subunit E
MGTAFARFGMFAALWLVLIGGPTVGDLVFGTLVAALAAWASLRLLPPAAGRVHFLALAASLPRFVWRSVVAGIDVARRAFDPRLPLATGFVRIHTGFPRGPARCAFATITSLMPGTVPACDDAEGIEYHCLDISQPVADELADEERRYAAALEAGRRSG